MGVRVAQALNYPMVNNYLEMGHGLYVVEIHVKSNLHDTPLSKLISRGSYNIQPILVKREEAVYTNINDEFVLNEFDTLLLCGSRAELKHVAPRLV